MATRNPSLNIRPDLAKAAGLKKAALDGSNSGDYLVGPRPAHWYTGKHPTQCPGYCPKDDVLRALPLPCTHNFTRQSVLDYFDNTWAQTEVRCSHAVHALRACLHSFSGSSCVQVCL